MKNSDLGVGCLVSWVPFVPRGRYQRLTRRYGIVIKVLPEVRDYSTSYTLIKVRSNDGKFVSLDSREVQVHGKFTHRV